MGTDGLPASRPAAQLGQTAPPPTAGLSALWPFLGGAVLAFVAVKYLLPEPGS
jgi:hypothetical protein